MGTKTGNCVIWCWHKNIRSSIQSFLTTWPLAFKTENPEFSIVLREWPRINAVPCWPELAWIPRKENSTLTLDGKVRLCTKPWKTCRHLSFCISLSQINQPSMYTGQSFYVRNMLPQKASSSLLFMIIMQPQQPPYHQQPQVFLCKPRLAWHEFLSKIPVGKLSFEHANVELSPENELAFHRIFQSVRVGNVRSIVSKSTSLPKKCVTDAYLVGSYQKLLLHFNS